MNLNDNFNYSSIKQFPSPDSVITSEYGINLQKSFEKNKSRGVSPTLLNSKILLSTPKIKSNRNRNRNRSNPFLTPSSKSHHPNYELP